MLLPQLDFTLLSSQIFWLFITTFIVYWFNKKIFLPSLLKNMQEREKLLQKLIDEKEALHKEIKSLKLEITETFLQNQAAARVILSDTLKECQELLQKQISRINQDFQQKAEDYSIKGQEVRKKLEVDLHLVVDDIKAKVKNFITYRC